MSSKCFPNNLTFLGTIRIFVPVSFSMLAIFPQQCCFRIIDSSNLPNMCYFRLSPQRLMVGSSSTFSTSSSLSSPLMTSSSYFKSGLYLAENLWRWSQSSKQSQTLRVGTGASMLQRMDSRTSSLREKISVLCSIIKLCGVRWGNIQGELAEGGGFMKDKYIYQMDNRLYHYEYRRPRLANPTFSSSNVNGSMTFFMGSPRSSSTYEEMNRSNSYSQRRDSQVYQPSMPPVPRAPQELDYAPRDRTHSNLSSYGNSSLAFNQREIYDKQNSKFNIISLKPKEVPDQIKQYPKLTLEDKDAFYYQKMQMIRDHEAARQSTRYRSNSGLEGNIAGKHTYAPEEGKNPSYYQQGRYFTPKMLNHADEVSNIL